MPPQQAQGCSKNPHWGSPLPHRYHASLCLLQAAGFVYPVQRSSLYKLKQPWPPFEAVRQSMGDSPQPGDSRAARCVGCWRSSSPESPPGGCGPAGRAASPPLMPARRHQLALSRGVVPYQESSYFLLPMGRSAPNMTSAQALILAETLKPAVWTGEKLTPDGH